MDFLTGVAESLYMASVWVLPVLLAVTLHEAAHGLVAWRLGDSTAKEAGRLTLNPLRHIDPVGTVVLPVALLLMRAPFLFGWAKPVPVDPGAFANPRRDMAFVAAAGPGANLLLAIIAAASFHLVFLLPNVAADWTALNLIHFIQINLILAVFNMLPLPPLDGGRVAVSLLPPRLAVRLARLERFGVVILLAVLFGGELLADFFGDGRGPLTYLVGVPVAWLAEMLLHATGVF